MAGLREAFNHLGTGHQRGGPPSKRRPSVQGPGPHPQCPTAAFRLQPGEADGGPEASTTSELRQDTDGFRKWNSSPSRAPVLHQKIEEGWLAGRHLPLHTWLYALSS